MGSAAPPMGGTQPRLNPKTAPFVPRFSSSTSDSPALSSSSSSWLWANSDEQSPSNDRVFESVVQSVVGDADDDDRGSATKGGPAPQNTSNHLSSARWPEKSSETNVWASPVQSGKQGGESKHGSSSSALWSTFPPPKKGFSATAGIGSPVLSASQTWGNPGLNKQDTGPKRELASSQWLSGLADW